jgi:hypothetical protein
MVRNSVGTKTRFDSLSEINKTYRKGFMMHEANKAWTTN